MMGDMIEEKIVDQSDALLYRVLKDLAYRKDACNGCNMQKRSHGIQGIHKGIHKDGCIVGEMETWLDIEEGAPQ